MPSPQEPPAQLGVAFSVREAAEAGLSRGRLRASDLSIPFRGVRSRTTQPATTDTDAVTPTDPYAIQSAQRRARNRDYAPRLRPEDFLSHESAAAEWNAPLPLLFGDDDEQPREPLHGRDLPVHVSAFGRGALPRVEGVTRHRADMRTSQAVVKNGIRIATPTTTWAGLGTVSLPRLVALGDYFCRVWRPGIGRRDVGRASLATIDDLRGAIDSGRRVGITRLREAIELIREDSWSPRESMVRVELVTSGLPEPELNVDIFDGFGRFLGCVDMAYREQRVIVEYHGTLHSATYAKDVERIAALRAAGWTVIEVTAALLRIPEELVRRVRQALR